MKSEEITKALMWRYAVKTFDSSKKVSDEDLRTILESGRLAPSAVGLEPWKFVVLKNPELRTKLRAVSYDQTKITDASDIILVTYRTDREHLADEVIARTSLAQGKTAEELAGYKKMADGAAMTVDVKAQSYIPLGMMIETAALISVDACPMEGFDAAQVNELLGLTEKNLAVATILAVGYRGDDALATAPKTRRAYDDVVEIID